MQTIKIKYQCNDLLWVDTLLMYQTQYSSCLHFTYNRIFDSENNITEIELRLLSKTLNNIKLLDSWFIQSSIKEAKSIYNSRKTLEFSLTEWQKEHWNNDQIEKAKRKFEYSKMRPIFGSKKLFFKRQNHKITNEEYKIKKLSPLYSIGESNNKSIKGNRKFKINLDLNSITFQPNKNKHFILKLQNVKNRLSDLQKLYILQEEHKIAISYKIDQEFIYISFDESVLPQNTNKITSIKNRVMSIDMNPDYIGWSIVDWKSENKFNIIKSGVFSLKQLTNELKSLKGKQLKSSSKEKKYLNNKRNHETLEISKNLIQIALHYKCELFGLEDLNIKSSDKNKGKNYNRLCNNTWLRNTLVNNLSKRCHIFGIKIFKVKSEYSSFVGNFLFRHLNLPDMCLASFEIGRRTYEFYSQYIIKSKEQKKNIIFPIIDKFKRFYMKSLEEFHIEDELTLYEIYKSFKKVKKTYRLSIDLWNQQFIRCFSNKSKIKYILFN